MDEESYAAAKTWALLVQFHLSTSCNEGSTDDVLRNLTRNSSVFDTLREGVGGSDTQEPNAENSYPGSLYESEWRGVRAENIKEKTPYQM